MGIILCACSSNKPHLLHPLHIFIRSELTGCEFLNLLREEYMWQSRVENVHYSVVVKNEFLTSIDSSIHPLSAVVVLPTSVDRTLSCRVIFAVTFALNFASVDVAPPPSNDIADRAPCTFGMAGVNPS